METGDPQPLNDSMTEMWNVGMSGHIPQKDHLAQYSVLKEVRLGVELNDWKIARLGKGRL